jgi:integrase
VPLAIARFCYQTGWRTKSEAFLKWAQVDWAGGFVRLEPGPTKNREGRAFPITPALRAILDALRARRASLRSLLMLGVTSRDIARVIGSRPRRALAG